MSFPRYIKLYHTNFDPCSQWLIQMPQSPLPPPLPLQRALNYVITLESRACWLVREHLIALFPKKMVVSGQFTDVESVVIMEEDQKDPDMQNAKPGWTKIYLLYGIHTIIRWLIAISEHNNIYTIVILNICRYLHQD